MRLIDADAFLKQEIKRCYCVPLVGTCSKDSYDLRYILNSTPTVDAVKVLRCINCVYHEDEEPDMVYCPNFVGGWVRNDFYCADGERKNNE